MINDRISRLSNTSGRPLSLILLVGVAACGSGAQAQTVPHEASSPSGGTATPDPVRLCKAIQSSEEIPVSCAFEVVDSRPHMLIGASSEQVLAQNLTVLLKHLVAPFCYTQGQAGESSGVIFVAGTRARQLECSSGKLSDWVETDPVVARTVAIEQACSTVQRGNYGVGCSLMDVEGTPALILSYESTNPRAVENLVAVAREVGRPFCELSRAAKVRGTTVFLDEDLTGRFFDCGTAQLSEPVSFRKQRKPNIRPSTPSNRPSGNGRPQQVASTIGDRWELLPERKR
ncbi:MAG: hypothetical protein K0R38_5534 [Polyangiaceae bacterium]|nr:hypothetical protein [Polyangiaceae bacterium]